ncbi:exopolysaccharide transport family protein [Bradyrhizobium sp. LHD-71]|nr:exopolysaccharide transport family protein [Bradyrhizobium sp. LHD-71]MDQ8726114.1 exopolysaccharide transport family protein [Bradyrhizobium sp. LHD-71]
MGDLDLRQVWNALMRKKAWIIVPTAIVAALSFAAVNTMTPRYKSEARILIDGGENVFLRPNAERAEERGELDAEAITSQVQIILSRDLALQIIRKNKLGDRPEFDSVKQGRVSPLRAMLAQLGIVRDPLKLSPEERVLEAYYDRLTAYAVEKSRVIAIEFQSSDPELAARVANSIAEGYLAMQQAARQNQARSAGQWLEGEIEDLRKKVTDAEARVENFRSRANLFVGNNNTTLSNQQMAELNTQLSNARAQKADAESKARLIRGMLQSGRPIEASEVLNSEMVRRLSEQRATLQGLLAEQSATLLGNHPRIRELRAQISELDRQLRDEAARVSRSLENDARIAGARAESMSASLDQLKKQATSTNAQDVQLRALEREARAQRELLESYLARFREATTRENLDTTPSGARIISHAIVSNVPAFPKKLPIVLIATLATLMLSAGSIVTAELLKMTAPRSDAGARLPAAAAAATAPPPGREEPPEFSAPISELERVAAELRALGAGARKITVIGVEPSAGTSLTALALARLLVRDASVVLVDLSMVSATIKAVMADPSVPGLSDLVQGTASFGELIGKDRMSRVQIVGAGTGRVDTGMLQSPRLAMTVDALMRVYDHVILDAGSLDDIPEQLVAPNAHAVLIATELDTRMREVVRNELLGAGFRGVTMLDGPVDPSMLGQPGGRAAA